MNKIGLREHLAKYVTLSIYPDFVPEKAKLPAIAYTHISNTRNRILDGSVNAKTDTWRISIICNSRAECDTILKQLEALDMSSSIYFKNVLIISVNDEPTDPDYEVIRSFIDLKTIDK